MRWITLLILYIAGLLLSGVYPATLIHPTVAVFAFYFSVPATLLLTLRQYAPRERLLICTATIPFVIYAFYLDLPALLSLLMLVAFGVLANAMTLRLAIRRTLFALAHTTPVFFAVYLMGGSTSPRIWLLAAIALGIGAIASAKVVPPRTKRPTIQPLIQRS